MANDKKMVEAITSMDEDFAQWYTDVVKKAELCDYTSVKGFMAIKPYGYRIYQREGMYGYQARRICNLGAYTEAA